MEGYTDEELQEMDRRRRENIRMRDALFQSFSDDPAFIDALKDINSFSATVPISEKRPSRPPRPKKLGSDPTFKFNGAVPLERRLSCRIRKLPPEFTYDDLPAEDTDSKRRFSNYSSLDNLEDIVSVPIKRRAFSQGPTSRPPIIPVEDVTEEMLANIVIRCSRKVYDTENGTSCHQCRQKTRDTKTCCRNPNCIGIRGQYCGACLKNRYGEDAAVALLDPNWTCLVCRGICNCSFCRIKQGKVPTGILAPIVQKKGFDSVQEYLEYVRTKREPDAVLGFDDNFAYMVNGSKYALKQEYKLKGIVKVEDTIQREKYNNNDIKTEAKTPEIESDEGKTDANKIRVSSSLFKKKNKEKKLKRKLSLIGFSPDLRRAIYDNGIESDLKYPVTSQITD